MSEISTQSQQSAATPVYILRGHASPIHALDIFAQNMRVVSGDAEGWIVIWDVVTKRPVVTWKAHEGAVLEVKGFSVDGGASEIYTHGRDHKLCVWKLRKEDEDFLDKTLPVDALGSNDERGGRGTKPWLLHSMPVNALNFCAFSMTFINQSANNGADNGQNPEDRRNNNILFAVPNALDSGGIDIFHLPSELRLTTIRSDPNVKTGMVMGVGIFLSSSGDLYVTSAYEDGHVMAFVRRGPLDPANFDVKTISSNPWKWEKLYSSRPHSQPVLSIDVSPSHDCFFSSSADALLIKHPIPTHASTDRSGGDLPLKTVNTKHSGQQGLRIRGDNRIFATAGWDSRVRVYSGKTMKELAVLKWHKDGCYAIAFGKVDQVPHPISPSKAESQSFSLATVRNQRDRKVQQTHWLAVGSKDGKISLWDIY